VRPGVLLLMLILGGVLVSGLGVLAQGPGYDLSWWTVDGGGSTFSTGGGYALGGTIGQADAGELSASGYRLVGGFWGGVATGVVSTPPTPSPGPGGPNKLWLPLIGRR
jgi:hypothetical protein